MTAKLYAMPNPPLTDIPAMLRNIADAMESGDYGGVTEAAVVLAGDELEVFGLGGADATVAYYLLGRGQRKLERIDLIIE